MDKIKPLHETESFRAWTGDKDAEPSDKDIKVKVGDQEFYAVGFNKVFERETNRLIFAYKIKMNEPMFLYYLPETTSKEEAQALEELKRIFGSTGLEVRNIEEFFKSIALEQKTMNKKMKLQKEENFDSHKKQGENQ